ncbi:MAG: hypothetical protein GY839_12785 [candidate division Zixibacteria bacterium]|nr:hypothetical protein [candidate division Zixibacteria bacterium]
MNCCETEVFRLGRFYPTLDMDRQVLASWMNRDVLNLSPCKECALALVCGGGCSRLVLNHGMDFKKDVVCPPMLNMGDMQILMDYYIPLILKEQGNAL